MNTSAKPITITDTPVTRAGTYRRNVTPIDFDARLVCDLLGAYHHKAILNLHSLSLQDSIIKELQRLGDWAKLEFTPSSSDEPMLDEFMVALVFHDLRTSDKQRLLDHCTFDVVVRVPDNSVVNAAQDELFINK